MSAILEYRIKAVKRRLVDSAQRYAVLAPLTGPKGVEISDDAAGGAQLGKALTDLRRQWVARVTQLRKLGWARVQNKGWVYAVNCPPFSAIPYDRGYRPCCQYMICPFCWARRVVKETFERAAFALFSAGPATLDLVEVISTWKLPRTEPKTLDAIFDWLKDNKCGVLRNDIVSQGALVLHTVEPSTSYDKETKGSNPVWVLQQRILALQDPSDPTPDAVDSNCHRYIRRHLGVNRTILASAVGRVCVYPVQMLRGSAEDALRVINLRGSLGKGRGSTLRLSGYYGLMRNKMHRKRVAMLHSLEE